MQGPRGGSMLREREKIMLEKERGRAFDLVRLFGAFGGSYWTKKWRLIFLIIFGSPHMAVENKVFFDNFLALENNFIFYGFT
jgi:hypothetical protein